MGGSSLTAGGTGTASPIGDRLPPFAVLPRVAFDMTPARLGLGGSSVYATELSAALHLRLDDRFVTLGCPATRALPAVRTMRDRSHTLLRDLWWFRGGSAAAARRAGASLLHSAVAARSGRARMPVILTVFDLAVLRHPEKFRRWFREYARRFVPGMIREARAVITLSRASRDEIADLARIEPERVTVIPCGVSGDFTARATGADAAVRALLAERGVPGDFLLTVGAREPRKNLDRLLRALVHLRGRRETADVHLVHAGPAGWLEDDLPARARALGIHAHVHFLGVVRQEHLAALYRLARVVAYPSLYEGFGLPVAEAMAAGAVVVTSDRSSLPEVAGDAAVLVDPTDDVAIAEGIFRAWTDEGLRAVLATRGLERAARFTWDAAAEATLDVYRRAVNA